jgi:hypothetical protein
MRKFVTAILIACSGALVAAQQPAQLGALAPQNLKKARAAAPFDLTGTWQHDGRFSTWRFVPEPGQFKLTPEAQKHYDAGNEAIKKGGAYHDDISQCWPAGMPLIMTRVADRRRAAATVVTRWPGSKTSADDLSRWPQTRRPTKSCEVQGESIGLEAANELVVDTLYFPGHHHRMDQGGAFADQRGRAHDRAPPIKDGR